MKIWIDANQGEVDGHAFGYIGTDGEYCGWFFDWPGETTTIETPEERDAVLASLALDETGRHLPPIPQKTAADALATYLERVQ